MSSLEQWLLLSVLYSGSTCVESKKFAQKITLQYIIPAKLQIFPAYLVLNI